MPPLLALLLCSSFVLVLLRWEAAQSKGKVSRALWIPTIWLLSISSKPLAIWFGSVGDPEAGSPLDRNLQTALLLAGMAILASRRVNWRSAFVENRWFVVLIAFKFVSILWSDIPFVSFKRGVRELAAIAMAFVILSERNPRLAIQSIFQRAIYILIPYSLMLIKYFPEHGVLYGRWSGEIMWVGATMHKTGLGCLCLIAIFFLAWTFYRYFRSGRVTREKLHIWGDVSVLVLALFLMFLTPSKKSATAIFALALGAGAFAGLLWLRKHRIALNPAVLGCAVVAVVAFGTAMPFTGGSIAAGVNASVGRDESFTGRTDVWKALIPVALKSPVLGSGLGSFWTPKTREEYNIPHAHNSYLEVLLEFGFVGLFLFLIFLLSIAAKARRLLAYDFEWGCFCICYLLMGLLHGATESSVNSFIAYLGATFPWLIVSCSTRGRPTVAKLKQVRHPIGGHVSISSQRVLREEKGLK